MNVLRLTLTALSFLLTACAQPIVYSPNAAQVAKTEFTSAIHIPDIPSTFDASKNQALQEYLLEVVANNKDLKSLASTIQTFELEESIRGADALPKVSGNFSKQKNERSHDENDFEFIEQDDINASINASWAVDIWGRLADQTKAAKLQTQQQALEYHNARRVLLAQAARTWLALWRIQNLILHTEQRVNNSLHFVSTLEDYFLNGETGYETVSQQRTNAIQLQEELIQLKAEQQIHRHRLNILRGRSPKTPITLSDNNVQAVITRLPAEIPATYLHNRPDILSAFKQIEILDTQTRASHKALLPRFSLTGALSRNAATIADTLSGDLVWQFVGGLTQTLFDTSQLRNQARQKSKQAASSFYRYEQIVLDAMEEVENSLANEKELHTHLVLTQKRLDETERLISSNEDAYKNGSVNVTQLLLAKDQFLQMQNEWIEVQTQYLNNRISLVLATGQPLQVTVE